ncbi:MAG TPA: Xaa-Pro peptidase family protein [Candidatus Rubneribacter avistercoris]|nr:Xaa-Pro peptidase family protein [Candidatus Rubneribacter avistercoris]
MVGEGASAAKGDAASDGDGDAASARRLETPHDASAPDAASAAPRLARLRDACATEGLDAFFVRDTSNIKWLTAFDGVFDDEAAHALMVTPQKAVLHTDSRYAEAARAAAAREGLVNVDDARKSHAVFAVDILRTCDGGVVEGLPPTELGIEDTITLADYHALGQALADAAAAAQMLGTSSFVVNLRAVKDAGEIARMKAAQAITDAAFSHIVSFMRPGMTEREVQRELEDFMLRHGAEGLAFPSIVATGPNGANPHAVPGSTVLEAGQCVVLDFGARAHGYCSDMTRTVFLGEPTPRLRDAYEAIRSANEQVEAALRPGVTGRAMHELAERALSGAGFAGKMGHGLGHGVGLDIHEEPVLSPRNERPLAVGNVVTVEPGVYVPGEFGMRLEDFGVVVEGGFEVFTKIGHDLVVV